MFRLYFSNIQDELDRRERPVGKEEESMRDKFEGSHVLLTNSLKVENDRENYLVFESDQLQVLSCLPTYTDNMENVTQHVENSHYRQEGMTLKLRSIKIKTKQ